MRAKRAATRLAKRLCYHGLYPLAYRLGAIRAVDGKRMLFVEMNAEQVPNSFSLVMKELERRGFTCDFITLRRLQGGGAAYALRCVAMAVRAARSRLVFVCDGSMPVSCLPLRQGTHVVQLWHACGAFKRFGMSTADAKFGNSRAERKEFPYYAHISLATVSSPKVVWAYEEAMGLEGAGVVRPLGVSRADSFFDEGQREAWRQQARNAVPELAGRRVLLYAPTFRGQAAGALAPNFLDVELLRRHLGDGWALLVKHHPFVHERPPLPADCADFAFDVSETLPIEAAMCVANACVTDYSSLVFEWSLLGRPVAFLAPDRADYDDWRGFYYDYDQMTPGPVFSTTEELAGWVASLPQDFDAARLADFRRTFMECCDGNATVRIVDAALALGEGS